MVHTGVFVCARFVVHTITVVDTAVVVVTRAHAGNTSVVVYTCIVVYTCTSVYQGKDVVVVIGILPPGDATGILKCIWIMPSMLLQSRAPLCQHIC